MSNEVFPTLQGLTWSGFKEPKFNTAVQTSVSLSELRVSFTATPIYTIKLAYDILRDDLAHDELKNLMGFFMARGGRQDSFLYLDPEDYQATAQLIGVGDGIEADFQLTRSFGDFTEKVSNGIVVTELTVSNTPTANYTVSSTGLVTMNSPPAANAPVAWTGTYYYRCRFTQDTSEFEHFMYQLWRNQSVELLGNLGTKL